MVCERKCSVIVMLSDLVEQDEVGTVQTLMNIIIMAVKRAMMSSVTDVCVLLHFPRRCATSTGLEVAFRHLGRLQLSS